MSELTKEQLVDLVLALDVQIGTLERSLKELEKQQAEFERQLVARMEEHDEVAYLDDNGRKVTRDDRMYLSIRNEQKPQWFEWLHDIRRADLVRMDFNKSSLNAIIKKIIRGELDHKLPEVFDLQRDLFFKPHVSIKLGQKSLRKAASEAE